jgi:putative tRNA adenosine deaminase-associated protein
VTTKAVAIAHERGRWRAYEIGTAELEDLDSLTDAMREFGDGPVVAFVEEDDEYLAVVRLDQDADPRVFLSDRRVLFTSELAARLLAEALPVVVDDDDVDDDDEGVLDHAHPIGDLDVLTDLGTEPERLLELIGEEGMLPADIIAALSERAGAGEILDEVRG